MIKFSILITTKNRLEDLKITLQKISHLLEKEDVECIIYDDASTDNTFEFLKEEYPNIILLSNSTSKGLIHNRNYLLNNCHGKYAISLDDDSNFITENSLELIENHFNQNVNCGVIACRVFWGLEEPEFTNTNQIVHRVKGFVGCGHVWNIEFWKMIPNYPEWYFFYGEEDFASLQLMKKDIEIHYVPEILVHHRVNVSARKNDKDYQVRRRRSLRAAWYNYFIFYPFTILPKKMSYSIWQQIKNHTFKGNLKATLAMFQAIFDVIVNIPNFIKNSNRLSDSEYKKYTSLPEAKIYWNPNEK